MPAREAEIDAMVRQYDRLIRWYCRRYGRCVKGSTPDDHYSVALIGAIDAYDTFDPDRGVQFTTHLRYRVRAALSHEFDARREDAAIEARNKARRKPKGRKV